MISLSSIREGGGRGGGRRGKEGRSSRHVVEEGRQRLNGIASDVVELGDELLSGLDIAEAAVRTRNQLEVP